MTIAGLGTYDPDNIFARILRGEIPATVVFEDEHVVAFNDIAPRAPQHVLVVPRGPYVSFADFVKRASHDEVCGFFRAVGLVAAQLGLDAPGYRMLSNVGEHGGQEVPHFHVHLFGGRPLGPMLVSPG
jgi:histidine triad (HIT) family protein